MRTFFAEHLHASLLRRNGFKKEANLSVNSDLLEKARAHGINLSQTLEVALIEALNEQRRKHGLDTA